MNLNSTVRFTSNGSVTTVDLTYNVQDTDQVQVFFEGAEQTSGWTLNRQSSPQRVTFTTSPPAGAEVLIRRYTDMREVPHEFYQHGDGRGGAEFNAKNLDENFDKIKRAAQDAMDSFELVGINVEAARDAEQYAQEAKGYRDTALTHRNQAQTAKIEAEAAKGIVEGFKNDAQTAKSLAEQAANNALASENTVSTKANEADLAALAASQSEGAALQHKLDAETAKTDAQTARGQAQGYATNAGVRAGEAQGFASAAQQSASNASVSEGAAFSSEQVAITKAGEAAQSAEEAYKWANEEEDIPVESGSFSAKHWALKAQEIVGGDQSTFIQDTATVTWTGTGTAIDPYLATVGTVTWDNLANKPVEFPPSSHTHDFTTLTNRPAYYPTNWASVASKPTTFAPDPHSHTWDSVADKPVEFPPTSHNHTWAQITEKPTSFPVSWGDVSNKPSTFPPSTHSHTWASITGKPSTFSPSSHTHTSSQISDRATTNFTRGNTTRVLTAASAGRAMVGQGSSPSDMGDPPTRYINITYTNNSVRPLVLATRAYFNGDPYQALGIVSCAVFAEGTTTNVISNANMIYAGSSTNQPEGISHSQMTIIVPPNCRYRFYIEHGDNPTGIRIDELR